jgi:hypothetical protein
MQLLAPLSQPGQPGRCAPALAEHFIGGRADAAQRITGAELAGLLGMDTGDLPGAENTGGDECHQQAAPALEKPGPDREDMIAARPACAVVSC